MAALMSKRIEDMTEAEIVEFLGPPDEITDHARMLGTAWKCWTCVEVVISDTPMPVPAPCPRCGGIAFDKVR